ncbi:MAG: redoxin domain-containing protein [Planctomycetaceae bacterium]|nr:redoxin domain-containing protein [Planctomycetaceae bacterium]
MFLVAVFGSAVLQAAEEKSGELETKVNALIEAPFTGTLEEYPAYAMRLGDEILALVEPCFQEANLSPERKSYLAQTKNLGLLLRYGFDEAEYDKKYEKFLEAIQDYPLWRKWIDKKYYLSANQLKNLDQVERAKALSQLLDRWAPLINKYFIDEKRDSNEQLPSIIVDQAASVDPDGSLGLVRSTVEKLRPVLEADAKRPKYDLLGSCAQESLNSLQRLDMAGKPLEYAPSDLDGKTIDIKSLKGKTVLIVTLPYQWEEEKLACIKKLYDGLKEHGLEIILASDDSNIEVARQKYKSHGESWIVVTRYGAGKDRIDYTKYFGTFRYALIVNREGIVVSTWADGSTPELYEGLKPLFPEQAGLITEIAGEIRAIDGKIKRKSEEDIAKYTGETGEKLPELLQKLVTFQAKIRYVAPPEINLTLVNLLLASKDLPQGKRMYLLRDKVEILAEHAQKAVKNNPQMRPEIAYQEVDALVDELLKTAPPVFHHNLLFAKQAALYQMREYLKKTMKSGQEEYANEITKRFVEITKQAPESFYNNSNMFVMFYCGDLEDFDMEHSTQLAKSFVEQIIPVFAAKGIEYQQEAKRLEGVLRRLSLIGSELEFECVLMNGDKINVKDLRGKVVTVNIWATTCGPCVGEFPNMKTQYEKYKDRGYEMIAYSTDSDLDAVVKFQEKNQYPWLIGSQVKSKEAGLTDYDAFYGVRGIPTTFLLDRSGKVRFMMCGSDDEMFNRELEKLFAEKP